MDKVGYNCDIADKIVTLSMYSKYMRYSGRTSSWSKRNHSRDLGLLSGTLSVL